MAGLLGDETGAGRKPYVAPRQVTLAEDVKRLGGLLSSLMPDAFQHGSLSGAARNTARALQGGHYKVEYGPNGEVYQTDEWVPYDGGQMDRLLGVNPLLEFAGGAGVAAPLAKVPKGALMAFGDVGNIRGKHASPHKFDRFDLSKIGTGEGAQAYGHGGYLAEADAVFDNYFRKFSEMSNVRKPDDEALSKIKPRLDEIAQRREELVPGYSSPMAASRGLDMSHLTADEIDEFISLGREADDLYAGGVRDTLERNGWGAHAYEVELDAKPEEMLDWDKPLSEQSEQVRKVLDDLDVPRGETESELFRRLKENGWADDEARKYAKENAYEISGSMAYRNLGNKAVDDIDINRMGSPNPRGDVAASQALREKGIKGIRYLDGNSRGKGEGTYNYVFFDDKDALIHTRDGEPIKGLLAD